MSDVPMVEAFRRWADRKPTKSAVTVEGATVSFAELDTKSNRLARALLQLGVDYGDFVTIALPNSLGFIEAALAVLKVGAVVQPVSHRLTLRERQTIVELAQSKLVIGAPPEAHPGRQCILDLAHLVLPSDAGRLPVRISPAWRAPTSGGSTGRPKLIVSVAPAVLNDHAPPDYMLPTDSSVVIPGPLFHSGPLGITLTALWYGNHVVLERRFDARETLRLVVLHRAEYLLLVPTMMHRIWRLPAAEKDVDLSSLKVVLHFASSCSIWLKKNWIEWLGPDRIFELYSAADGPARTVISGTEWLEHKGSVGRCVRGEITILDDDGNKLGPGEPGEIWMRPEPGGPPKSYYIGAEARERDGWLSVGDLGWMDDGGYLYIVDRRTDLIVSGGENVYPAEVEAALDEHPGVSSSAVIGLPDDDLGQRVHAIVQVTSGVTERDLQDHMTVRLVRYKLPRSYEFVNFPLRDDAGKVRRSGLLSDRIDGSTTAKTS